MSPSSDDTPGDAGTRGRPERTDEQWERAVEVLDEAWDDARDEAATPQPRHLSRRRFLTAMGTTAGAGLGAGTLSAAHPPQLEQLEDNVYILQRANTTLSSYLRRYTEHSINRIQGAAPVDWGYAPRHSTGVVNSLLSSLLSSQSKVDTFQKHCPDEFGIGSPSSRSMAFLAGDGSLTVFHDGSNHYIPYPPDSGDGFAPARDRQGGFAGLRIGDEYRWQTGVFDRVDTTVGSDGTTLTFRSDGFEIVQRAWMPDGEEYVRMDYDVRNMGDSTVTGDFVYWLQANANDNHQNPIVFTTNRNVLYTEDDVLRWEDQASGKQFYTVLQGADGERSGGGRPPIGRDEWETVTAGVSGWPLPFSSDIFPHLLADDAAVDTDAAAGAGLQPRGGDGADGSGRRSPPDPAMAGAGAMVDEEELPAEFGEGRSWETILDQSVDRVEGRYLGGYLPASFELAPGESATFKVAVGTDRPDRLQDDKKVRTSRGGRRSGPVDGIRPAFQDQYRDSLRNIRELIDPAPPLDENTIAVPATRHQFPAYSRVWPRDMGITVEALATAGYGETAADGVRFLATLLRDEDHLRQCYFTDGGFAGQIDLELDQVAKFVETVNRVDREVGDDLLEEPAIRDAYMKSLAFLGDHIADNDLPTATPDYQEQPLDIRQSAHTAATMVNAVRGARARLELYDRPSVGAGTGGGPMDLEEVADRLEDGVRQELLSAEDWSPAIEFLGARRPYPAMAAGIYTKGLVEDPAYLEELLDHTGITNPEQELTEAWMPGTLRLARATYIAAHHSGPVEYDGVPLPEYGHRLLTAVEDQVAGHGAIHEFVDAEGDFQYSRVLAMTEAEWVKAVETERWYRETHGEYLAPGGEEGEP
ncbi:MAG: hypothetical protein SVW77_01995 [Candidatus Nanohaloarchaea archaeon]|nr:hypothetical protein [Candidatus Nanohaloarchaea archaeon]